MSKVKPYGSWASSLTAEKLADKGIRFGHMCVDGDELYWLESRSKEQGRSVLVKHSADGSLEDILPNGISVRTKVHEYGSGDFLVDQKIVYFVNAKDQCVYRFDGELLRLTEPNKQAEQRFADFAISHDKKFLICVRETHHENEVINELVSISLSNGKNDPINKSSVKVLHSGFDFYSFPRLTKLGHRLCWTCWNQPDMPWDAAELWVADIHQDGSLDAAHKIVGGGEKIENSNLQNQQSVYQPTWSDDGVLHYISDASGWTNIYSCRDGVLNALTPIDREFGIPQWVLASSTYALGINNQIYAVYIQQGQQQLCHIDAETGHIEPITLPFKNFGDHLLLSKHFLYFRAAGPAVEEAIYRFNIKTEKVERLNQLKDFPLSIEELSVAQSIEFKSEQQRACHAFYYKPSNRQYTAPENTLPPLIVMSHGGPTAMTNNSLNAAIQFWTHRGFAVVDVNYGGSTGYGKKYRDSLRGNWGIVDVEDCIAAAKYLVSEGLADEKSLLIRGGSAGGYTTLCALTFHDVFAAGMSRYGVADLESLASDSHKFEARYLDSMIGAYPQEKELYQARSPIHFTEKLSCPILLLQGEDDKVVPPNQAEMMVEALDKLKIPFAYQLYSGEGHGFRKSETIVNALNSELYFYRKVLDIEDSEKLEKIEIQYI
jgi:dipeptidyl aminopeptidase/acylaminoacyl peptidase